MWILTYDGIMSGVLKCLWAQSVRKRTGSNSASHVKTVQENIRTPGTAQDNIKENNSSNTMKHDGMMKKTVN